MEQRMVGHVSRGCWDAKIPVQLAKCPLVSEANKQVKVEKDGRGLYPHMKLRHDGFWSEMYACFGGSQVNPDGGDLTAVQTYNQPLLRSWEIQKSKTFEFARPHQKEEMPLSPAQSDRLRTYVGSSSFESCSRTLTRLLPSTSLPSPELLARAHQAILLHLAAYDDGAREVPLDTLAGVVLDTWQACRDMDLGSDGDEGGKEEGKQEESTMASGASLADKKEDGKVEEEQRVNDADVEGVKDMDISQSPPFRVRHFGPPQKMPTTTTITAAIEGEHSMGEASIELSQNSDELITSLLSREESGPQHISQSEGRLMRFVNVCLGWIWSRNFILGPLIILIAPKFWIPFFLRVLSLCPYFLPVINSLASLIWNYWGYIMTLFGTLANAWWAYALESSVGPAPRLTAVSRPLTRPCDPWTIIETRPCPTVVTVTVSSLLTLSLVSNLTLISPVPTPTATTTAAMSISGLVIPLNTALLSPPSTSASTSSNQGSLLRIDEMNDVCPSLLLLPWTTFLSPASSTSSGLVTLDTESDSESIIIIIPQPDSCQSTSIPSQTTSPPPIPLPLSPHNGRLAIAPPPPRRRLSLVQAHVKYSFLAICGEILLFYLALFSLRWLVGAVLNFLGRGDAQEELHPIEVLSVEMAAEELRKEILTGASMVSKWVNDGFSSEGSNRGRLPSAKKMAAEELRTEIWEAVRFLSPK